MLRRFSVNFAVLMMIVDAILVSVSLAVAAAIRPELSSIIHIAKSYLGPYIFSPWQYPIFSCLWVLILLLFSVYDGRKNFRFIDEQTSLTFGTFLAAIASAGLLYLTYREFSRALFGLFVLLNFVSMVALRLLYRLIFRIQAARGILVRRVLIIGAGTTGRKIGSNITDFTGLGLHLVGYLDDDPSKLKMNQVLGPIHKARHIIIRNQIDDVVMALPQSAYSRSNELAIELHDLPVRVWVVPDYFALSLSQARFENFANLPMIDLRAPALNDYQLMVKRVIDIVISSLLMLFLLPVMAIIVLSIRLDSPGPAIFRQKRVGENGRIFEMLKFRTMIEDADKKRHFVERVNERGRIIQTKNGNDPRITRVGKLLRKTSLDELPQFINVLLGDMSLVGPRPELPYLVDQYEPWQRARFSVPQGLTGWWQVNGRSDKPMHLNTEDDLYYIKNYSIWLDLKIIIKTIWAIVYHRGAY